MDVNFDERTLAAEFRAFLWGLLGLVSFLLSLILALVERVRAWAVRTEHPTVKSNEHPPMQVQELGGNAVRPNFKNQGERSAISTARMEGMSLRRVVVQNKSNLADRLHHPIAEPDQNRTNSEGAVQNFVGIPYNCNMGFESNNKWYAVAVGLTPGIYRTWPEAMRQVNKVLGARHMSFKPYRQAVLWMQRELGTVAAPLRTTHRLHCESLGIDNAGHEVFKCQCCAEVFCSNGY